MPPPTSPSRFPLRSTWRQKPPSGVVVNRAHPLTRNLIGCHLFNEGQGNRAYDITGNGHDIFLGLETNDPMGTHTRWGSGSVAGIHGPAVECIIDGGILDSGVTNVATPYRIPTGSTVSVEFWLLRKTGYAEAVLLESTGDFARLNTVDAGTGFKIQYEDALGSISNNSVLALNAWHHVVIATDVFGATSAQLHRLSMFINGRRDGGNNSLANLRIWSKLFSRQTPQRLFVGFLGLMRVWQGKSLTEEEAMDLYTDPFGMFQRPKLFVVAKLPPLQPARMPWRAQAARLANRVVRVQPAQLAWFSPSINATGVLYAGVVSVSMPWRTFGLSRTIQVRPALTTWRVQQARLPIGLLIRDCGDAIEAEVHRTSILADWLVQSHGIGLFASSNYDPDGTWEHRIVNISEIEISAPPGGGISSAANVTISIAENGQGQSILELWQSVSAVESVEITIDFYLPNIDQALRIFTGHIDSIIVKDSVSQILCVDESIRKNFMVPKQLVKVEDFPNADQASLTKVIPLVYGLGSKIGAAPMLLVDVIANSYLLASHPMRLGGSLAIYDQPTNTFLVMEGILFIPNNGNASITLGTVNTAGMRHENSVTGTINPTFGVDGDSATLTVVPTPLAGPFDSFASLGDGFGFAAWSISAPGNPLAGTVQITLTNHRRSPGSSPTTTGKFLFRTVDAQNPSAIERRRFMTTPAFRHTTSAQTDIFIVSNINIGINELFNIALITRCEGTVSGTGQTYEIGEVSVTPLVALSANFSGNPTAIGLPVNFQELRFNPQRPTLSIFYATSGVSNPTNAIDGNSATIATIRTSSLDSNLDGFGELIVTTVATSALRANNTVAIDLARHRRALTSDPTVTGTFSIQTYNTDTGVLLRDNLLVTQAFRHTTYPQVTSYTATGVNLGVNAQLAVRVVARNEGGVGDADQYYEVGEIGIESYYQPRGDSAEIFLYGTGYEGRTDVDGTVTDYLGIVVGQLYETPDMTIASMLIEEMFAPIDADSFLVANDFFGGNNLRFDGGIGAGWTVEQAPIRDILDAMARQSTSIIFPNFEDTWEIRPFRSNTLEHTAFDETHILAELGSESARPEDRSSTMQITLGDLKTVYNHFEVRYKYNAGSRKFDGIWKVTKDGSNLPEGLPEITQDKALIEAACLDSYTRYGDLEPLIIDANWIADDQTAAYLLRHLVFYFSQQRITLQFDVTFIGICLQVGDFIRVTEATIPDGDNGQLFEIHKIRYKPFEGRIQLTCSRVATLQDAVIPDPPAALTGCARFAAHPTLTQGLTACWDFDEEGGDRVDHIGGLILTDPVGTPRALGKVGYCAAFFSSLETMLYNENALLGHFLGEFTMAFWVRFREAAPASAWGIITNTGNTDVTKREWSVYTLSTDYIYADFHETSTGQVQSDTVLPFTDTDADWTLVCIWKTIDVNHAGVLSLQLNQGAIVTSAFTNANMTTQNAFCIGANYYTATGTGGQFSDILFGPLMIWSRVLTTDERAVVWNDGNG